jgi:hypothetical protein
MNAKPWIHGLWPAFAGAALLLPCLGVGDKQLDAPPRARKAIEAPLPRSFPSLVDGDHKASSDTGAIFVSGGSGSAAFRAKTSLLESRLLVANGAPSRLVVAFALATLGPAPNDPGPASTFEQRLATALGPSSDARLRLELQCAGRETVPGGIASRIRWQGMATSGRMSQPLDFCLWQGSRPRDGILTLGTFDWPKADPDSTQPPILGRPAEGGRLTIGLDLDYPTPN